MLGWYVNMVIFHILFTALQPIPQLKCRLLLFDFSVHFVVFCFVSWCCPSCCQLSGRAPFTFRDIRPQRLFRHRPSTSNRLRMTAGRSRSFCSKDSKQASLSAFFLLPFVWEKTDNHCYIWDLSSDIFPKDYYFLNLAEKHSPGLNQSSCRLLNLCVVTVWEGGGEMDRRVWR